MYHLQVTNTCSSNSVPSALPLAELFAKKHILLLHAGGDSKRVPWANPMGKVFLPLPYLASDDQDGPVPLLFDHILAIASCARQAFKNEGYFCVLVIFVYSFNICFLVWNLCSSFCLLLPACIIEFFEVMLTIPFMQVDYSS